MAEVSNNKTACSSDAHGTWTVTLTLLACVQLLLGDAASDADASGAARPMELLLGNAVKPLGKKSMGTVWMHHFGAELAAVKWIPLEDDPPHTAGYTAKQKESMMLREVEAMTVLRHPNIVTLLGITSMDTPAEVRAARRQQQSALETEQAEWGGFGDDFEDEGGDRRERKRHGRAGAGAAKASAAAVATVGIVLELCLHGTLQVRVACERHLVCTAPWSRDLRCALLSVCLDMCMYAPARSLAQRDCFRLCAGFHQ